MKSASSKVLFRSKSVLNQTSASVSLITSVSIVIKISTAIFRIMAPASDSGTFPGIIRGLWEVQVDLVRNSLQIRLRRADLTGRDGGFEEEVLKQLCGRLMSGSLKLLCKNNWGSWETMDSTAWSKVRVDFPPPTCRGREQTSILQNIFIVGNTDKTFPTFSMHNSQRKYYAHIWILLEDPQYLIALYILSFGMMTYHGMPANRWKDDTHSGILTHCLTPSCQEGEAAATGPTASQSRNVRLPVRLEVNILPTQDHATSTSKPCRRHPMTSPRQPPSTPYTTCYSKGNSHSCTQYLTTLSSNIPQAKETNAGERTSLPSQSMHSTTIAVPSSPHLIPMY